MAEVHLRTDSVVPHLRLRRQPVPSSPHERRTLTRPPPPFHGRSAHGDSWMGQAGILRPEGQRSSSGKQWSRPGAECGAETEKTCRCSVLQPRPRGFAPDLPSGLAASRVDAFRRVPWVSVKIRVPSEKRGRTRALRDDRARQQVAIDALGSSTTAQVVSGEFGLVPGRPVGRPSPDARPARHQ
jgi:hypothetical protein